MPYIDTNTIRAWGYTSSGTGGIIRITSGPLLALSLGTRFINFRTTTPYQFRGDKNYLFLTTVSNTLSATFGATLSFRLSSPFNNTTRTHIGSKLVTANAGGGARVYFYANPQSSLTTTNMIQIGADEDLDCIATGLDANLRVISRTDVYELDFLVNGYRQTSTHSSGLPSYGVLNSEKGWYFNPIDQAYWWNWSSNGLSPTYSTIGSGLSSEKNYNFIARRIEYDYINVKFDYATFSGSPTTGVSIYIGPDLNNRNGWQLIDTLTGLSVSSVTHQLIGLTGTNTNGTKNYFIISASESGPFTAKITNINFYGGYHPSNNLQFLLTNSNQFLAPTTLQILGLTAATYSFITGWGSTIGNTFSNISLVKSKLGNGLFKAGIWENGVWNSGWREDENSKDFDDIILSIATLKGIRWRIQIIGPEESVANFEIGDKVSIGNIVAIDINEERKLFRGTFTIIKINEESIVVETDTTFPYRRIEKDSPNHKIKVTKNIWLNGAFLNGYFTGIWNSGLVKGTPYLTELYDTHWIDGKFDGGHFNSNYPFATFDDTYYIVADTWGLDESLEGKLGLTFSSGHPYVEGDWIVIDKDDKSLNPNYDGAAQVLVVIDENLIVLDKNFGISSTLEGGFSFRWSATSVMQNLTFYDNNRSTKTSNQSSVSSDVFSFNSWMDVNYDPTRSVSIGKAIREFDNISVKSVNKNNLFGYPTYDILSSNSWFRDSYSLQQRPYKLGTKYKVFEDSIGEGSQFTEPFEPQTFTDEIILQFNKKRRDTNGAAIPFATTDNEFILTIVPLSTNRFNYSPPIEICRITEVLNQNTMAQNVCNAISNGYTASVFRNIVTIRDLDNNSYRLKGLDIDGSNYALKSDSSAGGLTVIYPTQRVFEYQTPKEQSNSRGQEVANSQERTISRSVPIDQEALRFGRVIEGVGYDNLTNAGWEITQASFSNSDIRRTEPSDTDENIIGEEIQINVVNDGITLNNNRVQLESNRYSVVEFDIFSYSISNEFYEFSNSDLSFARRGLVTTPTVDIPIIHLSNLNYELVNSRGGSSRFNNTKFITEVNRQYLPMSYLPINENINHLFTENTYRLDSIENISPDRYGGYGENRPTKKFEYFYSKKDLMLKVLGNGLQGASPSTVIMDNIKMYEVDMIPFFQYFKNENIYRGVQVPYQGKSPVINYADTDFNLLDNLSISLDSINIAQSLVPLANTIQGIASVQILPSIRPIRIPTTPRLLFEEEDANTGVPIPSLNNPAQQQLPGNESIL